jgi:hypothetical protein
MIKSLAAIAIRAFLVVFVMAGCAFAATITYDTSTSLFVGDLTPLVLNSTGGTASATLTFFPQVAYPSGVPSGISYGHFILACPACTTQGIGTGYATFPNFTFDLTVTDVTNGGVGTFVGTATGGSVYWDVSPITIDWAPLVLGPGTNNATTGSFGPTIFETNTPSYIVAPNSGDEGSLGRTSVQGLITATPEPASMALMGAGLLALGGLLRRKMLAK